LKMAAKLPALMCIVGAVALGVAQVHDRWTPTEDWFKEARIYERPKGGYVRNKDTAIAIGRAVMVDAYRSGFVAQLEPLDAKLFGDVWVVYSYSRKGSGIPSAGGVTTVEISKTSGSILSMRSER
jgi:hypothetical protein